MRKLLFLFIIAILTFSSAAYAQSGASALGCKDPAIRMQAEEIKQHYIKQGFEVFRDAMVGMEDQVPYPVVAELRRGELFQIVFVGNAAAQRIKLEVFDGSDNQIDSKVMLKDEPNYIIYTFNPQRSDAYLFSLYQRIKKRETCGSFFILRLAKKDAQITPYTGVRPAVIK